MEPRDPASVLAALLFPLGSGGRVPVPENPVGRAAQGTPGRAGSSIMSGEVLAAQMTAGLSLCLPARVKLDSWEAVNPDRCCAAAARTLIFKLGRKEKDCHTSPADQLPPRSKLCSGTLEMSFYCFTVRVHLRLSRSGFTFLSLPPQSNCPALQPVRVKVRHHCPGAVTHG